MDSGDPADAAAFKVVADRAGFCASTGRPTMAAARQVPCASDLTREAQHARISIAYCNEGCIAAPRPIFWRLPLMT